MDLLKNFRAVYSSLALVFLACSCSSVVFPDVVDDDETAATRYIEEGKGLKSDEENVAYDDTLASPYQEEKIAAARTIPVSETRQEGYRETVVKTNNAKFNALLEEGDPAVAKPAKSDYATTIVEPDVDSPNDNVVQTPDSYAPSISYQVDTFYFDNGSSSLDGKYSSNIRKIAKLAKQHNAIVNVYGYASSRTRNTDIASHKLANFNVSLKRAESVAAALRRAGVSAKSIKVEALSDSVPAYQEVMPEGERLNRRAEVYISY